MDGRKITETMIIPKGNRKQDSVRNYQVETRSKAEHSTTTTTAAMLYNVLYCTAAIQMTVKVQTKP